MSELTPEEMRARRLRRLGVATTVQSPLIDTQTINESLSKPNEVTLDAQKNKISPSIHGSVEIDEDEHKQKQLKFDEDIDVRQKKETILNNNDEPTQPKQSNLAGCSRLLLAHINQQENVLNQNLEGMITPDSNRMETDENCDEVTANIEKMETDECLPIKEPENQFQPETSTIDERSVCLSRILDAFWDDYCGGKIIVTETASDDSFKADIDYEDLTSQILIEISMQYFEGKLVDLKELPEDDKWIASTSTDSSCPLPMLRPFNPAKDAVLKYFIGAYNRSEQETLKYSNVQSSRKFDNSVLDMISNARRQIVLHTISLLANKLRPMGSDTTKYSEKSSLVKLLLQNEVPPDFLRSIVSEASKRPILFNLIFDEVVNNLNIYMQCQIAAGPKLCVTPIIALNELLNVTLIDEPTVRPICNLIAKKTNFYPKLTTDFLGREITRTSYLGPFLSISVFSEDNPRVLDDDLKLDTENISPNADNLRSQLENMRSLLHSVFHNFLKNVESRNGVLMYFSAILKHNDKRTQFHADDKTLARDGFMMNLMCVLQKLSVKIIGP